MDKANPAIEKLERIKQLWIELGGTKSNSPDYGAVMKKIRTLSAEYQALAAEPSGPGNQTESQVDQQKGKKLVFRVGGSR